MPFRLDPILCLLVLGLNVGCLIVVYKILKKLFEMIRRTDFIDYHPPDEDKDHLAK